MAPPGPTGRLGRRSGARRSRWPAISGCPTAGAALTPLPATMAAQQYVAARFAALGGHRQKRGAMAVAIFSGKARYGCETHWVTRHQMKALRALAATSMGRAKRGRSCCTSATASTSRNYTEPDGWFGTGPRWRTLDIPLEYSERCDSFPKRIGAIQRLRPILFATGVRVPSPLGWEIGGRRWRP